MSKVLKIDKMDVLEKVKQLKEEQEMITVCDEFIKWYNHVVNNSNLQPSEWFYNNCKRNLPKKRLKMMELEKELDKLLDGK